MNTSLHKKRLSSNFPEQDNRNPDAALLLLGERVHVPVCLHVEEAQPEVEPAEVEVELSAELLADLVNLEDGGELHPGGHPHPRQLATRVQREGGVVTHVVVCKVSGFYLAVLKKYFVQF